MNFYKKMRLENGMMLFILFLIGIYLFMNYIFSFHLCYKYDLQKNKIINEIEKSINGKLIYSIRLRKECNSDEEELILDQFDTIQDSCNCNGQLF